VSRLHSGCEIQTFEGAATRSKVRQTSQTRIHHRQNCLYFRAHYHKKPKGEAPSHNHSGKALRAGVIPARRRRACLPVSFLPAAGRLKADSIGPKNLCCCYSTRRTLKSQISNLTFPSSAVSFLTCDCSLVTGHYSLISCHSSRCHPEPGRRLSSNGGEGSAVAVAVRGRTQSTVHASLVTFHSSLITDHLSLVALSSRTRSPGFGERRRGICCCRCCSRSAPHSSLVTDLLSLTSSPPTTRATISSTWTSCSQTGRTRSCRTAHGTAQPPTDRTRSPQTAPQKGRRAASR